MDGANFERIAGLAGGQRLHEALRAAKRAPIAQGARPQIHLVYLWRELPASHQSAYAAAAALAQSGKGAEACYAVFALRMPPGTPAWAALPPIDQEAWATAATALRPNSQPKECS